MQTGDSDDEIAELRIQALLTKRENEAEVSTRPPVVLHNVSHHDFTRPPPSFHHYANQRGSFRGRGRGFVRPHKPYKPNPYHPNFAGKTVNPSNIVVLTSSENDEGINARQMPQFNPRLPPPKGRQHFATPFAHQQLSLPQDKYRSEVPPEKPPSPPLMSAKMKRLQDSASDTDSDSSADESSSSSSSDTSSSDDSTSNESRSSNNTISPKVSQSDNSRPSMVDTNQCKQDTGAACKEATPPSQMKSEQSPPSSLYPVKGRVVLSPKASQVNSRSGSPNIRSKPERTPSRSRSPCYRMASLSPRPSYRCMSPNRGRLRSPFSRHRSPPFRSTVKRYSRSRSISPHRVLLRSPVRRYPARSRSPQRAHIPTLESTVKRFMSRSPISPAKRICSRNFNVGKSSFRRSISPVRQHARLRSRSPFSKRRINENALEMHARKTSPYRNILPSSKPRPPLEHSPRNPYVERNYRRECSPGIKRSVQGRTGKTEPDSRVELLSGRTREPPSEQYLASRQAAGRRTDQKDAHRSGPGKVSSRMKPVFRERREPSPRNNPDIPPHRRRLEQVSPVRRAPQKTSRNIINRKSPETTHTPPQGKLPCPQMPPAKGRTSRNGKHHEQSPVKDTTAKTRRDNIGITRTFHSNDTARKTTCRELPNARSRSPHRQHTVVQKTAPPASPVSMHRTKTSPQRETAKIPTNIKSTSVTLETKSTREKRVQEKAIDSGEAPVKVKALQSRACSLGQSELESGEERDSLSSKHRTRSPSLTKKKKKKKKHKEHKEHKDKKHKKKKSKDKKHKAKDKELKCVESPTRPHNESRNFSITVNSGSRRIVTPENIMTAAPKKVTSLKLPVHMRLGPAKRPRNRKDRDQRYGRKRFRDK